MRINISPSNTKRTRGISCLQRPRPDPYASQQPSILNQMINKEVFLIPLGMYRGSDCFLKTAVMIAQATLEALEYQMSWVYFFIDCVWHEVAEHWAAEPTENFPGACPARWAAIRSTMIINWSEYLRMKLCKDWTKHKTPEHHRGFFNPRFLTRQYRLISTRNIVSHLECVNKYQPPLHCLLATVTGGVGEEAP